MTDAWQDFFAAQVGASSALLGLLFVGVSLNLARILSLPPLPNRALLALLLLLAVLIISLLLLIPGQPAVLLAIEVSAIGAILAATGVVVLVAGCRATPSYRLPIAANFVLSELSAGPYLVAGVLLFLGDMSALAWIAAGMIVSVIKAVTDAWVLLVEINR